MTTPTLIPGLENLASRGKDDIARLLEQAYQLGRADMKRELMQLLSPSGGESNIALAGRLPDANGSTARTSAKAPPGTVKPAILRLVRGSPGLSTEEIIAQTGFKENSVRGTLSSLMKQGLIERRDNHWVRKEIEAPAASAGASQ